MIQIFQNDIGVDEQRILGLDHGHGYCAVAVRFLWARKHYSGSYTPGLRDIGFWYSRSDRTVRLGRNHLITVRVPTGPARYPVRYFEEGWSVLAGTPQVLAELVYLHELYHHIGHDHPKLTASGAVLKRRSSRYEHLRCGRFVLSRMGIDSSVLLPGTKEQRVAARMGAVEYKAFLSVQGAAVVS